MITFIRGAITSESSNVGYDGRDAALPPTDFDPSESLVAIRTITSGL